MEVDVEERARNVRRMNDLLVNGPERASITAGLSKQRLATACVCGVVCLTVLMAEGIQKFIHSKYQKPCYTTWIVHCDGLFLLVPLLWWYYSSKKAANSELSNDERASMNLNTSTTPTDEPTAFKAIWNFAFATSFTRFISIILTVVVFVSEYFLYLSLPRVSVSASLGITNSAPVWVLILSVIFLGEGVTIAKILSVCCCFLGVILISFSGTPLENSNSAGGYFAAIGSAMFMAIFLVIYKYFHGIDSSVINNQQLPTIWRKEGFRSSFVFLVSLSIWNLLILWPIVVIWHFSGIEAFEVPTFSDILSTFGLMIADLSINVLLLFAVQIASPFFVSSGMLCVVPFAMIADMIALHYVIPIVGLFGLLFVCSGLLALAWLLYSPWVNSLKQDSEQQQQQQHSWYKKLITKEFKLKSTPLLPNLIGN